MRVIVNQLSALGQRTGVGHYASQLFRCLQAQAGEVTIDSFPVGFGRRIWESGARIRSFLEPSTQDWKAERAPLRWAESHVRTELVRWLRQCGRSMRARHFRAVCQRHRYVVYHEPNFIPLPTDRPTVATLHDLSFLLHPEWHPSDRVRYFDRYFAQGLKRCEHFLAISEFGRQEIMRVLNIAPHRISRTYMGVRPGLHPLSPMHVRRVLRDLALPPQYLLYLGTIEPRKNVLMLLRSYCALPQPLRDRWPLLLVGSWGWNSEPIAEYFQREARHRGVIHIGYASEENLAAIYNGARALLYPSFYEGFGMPPLEMMSCGGAVLASTAGALVETVGHQAHLIHPEDSEEWRDAIERVVTDDDWWTSLRNGSTKTAQPYTWEQCAADTLKVYRSLMSTVPRAAAPSHCAPCRVAA
jgi:glycosyltransferase involved in cell wall biosynthesis